MTAKILRFPASSPVPAEAIHDRQQIIIHDCAKHNRIWPVRDGEKCRWCGQVVTAVALFADLNGDEHD